MVSSSEHPPRLALVLGGARGGKSTFAERLVAARAGDAPVVYLATSEANDREMAARVAAHQQSRTGAWTTVECPLELAAAVRSAAAASSSGPPAFLLDCVTFWVSNLLFAAGDLGGTTPEGLGNFDKAFIAREVEAAVAARIGAAVDDLLAAVRETDSSMVAVSNEVGFGVVPEYPIGRLYRDELGRANHRLADDAAEVYLLVAGIPIELKALAADPFTFASSPQEGALAAPRTSAPSTPEEEEHDS